MARSTRRCGRLERTKTWFLVRDQALNAHALPLTPLWAAVFGEDLEGHKNTNNPRIMGARNFVAVKVKPESGDLEFDLRMELKRGEGKTKSYVGYLPYLRRSKPLIAKRRIRVQPVVAPAPNYSTRS